MFFSSHKRPKKETIHPEPALSVYLLCDKHHGKKKFTSNCHSIRYF